MSADVIADTFDGVAVALIMALVGFWVVMAGWAVHS